MTLVMEAGITSETSVNFFQSTRHNNTEDSHCSTASCSTASCFDAILVYTFSRLGFNI
jgi:hypothetical protein